MTYFLFYDGVMGDHFVIEGDDNWVAEDAYEEARYGVRCLLRHCPGRKILDLFLI